MMQKLFFLLVPLCFLSCKEGKREKMENGLPAPSRHSTAYNASVRAALDDYERLTEALVRWDSAAVPGLAQELHGSMHRLQPDSSAKEAAVRSLDTARLWSLKISSGSDLTAKRLALHGFTQHFYRFLQASAYDAQPLYLNLCAMAFNDVEEGLWISRGDSIRNPYLGLHHPVYGKGMLECGELKEALNAPGQKE